MNEELQKLVFPSGISYDVKEDEFRTEEVNELFSKNASLNSVSEDDNPGLVFKTEDSFLNTMFITE